MMAYLTMMAVRLIELHRELKPTESMKFMRFTLIVGLCATAGCHRSPDAQAVALRESLIRLRVATEQGASLAKFGDLLLDASTKCELAKGHVSDDASKGCAQTVSAATDARDIWQSEMDKEFPSSVEIQMMRLGVVKNHYEFAKYLADSLQTDPDFENDSSAVIDLKREARDALVKVIVGKALGAVHAKAQQAERAIPSS